LRARAVVYLFFPADEYADSKLRSSCFTRTILPFASASYPGRPGQSISSQLNVLLVSLIFLLVVSVFPQVPLFSLKSRLSLPLFIRPPLRIANALLLAPFTSDSSSLAVPSADATRARARLVPPPSQLAACRDLRLFPSTYLVKPLTDTRNMPVGFPSFTVFCSVESAQNTRRIFPPSFSFYVPTILFFFCLL